MKKPSWAACQSNISILERSIRSKSSTRFEDKNLTFQTWELGENYTVYQLFDMLLHRK